MAKAKSVFVCQSCGAQHPKWSGRCGECGSWNSLVEENFTSSKSAAAASKAKDGNTIEILGRFEKGTFPRVSSGLQSVDRVLGGGFVPGSLILIGGEPGIGKSTLLLQVLGRVASREQCLYVSGEESGAQVAGRAERLQIEPKESLKFLSTLSLEALLNAIDTSGARFVVVDSIQTFQSQDFESVAGSVSQVRALCHSLLEVAKTKNVTILLVGQVTKEGSIAGPKLIEHMVDAVFSFELASSGGYRMLKAQKNRFGAVNEMAVFEMGRRGLDEVMNPSERFLQERNVQMAGSAVVCQQEGTQIFLAEVQSLVSRCHVGYPRRTTQGVDANRLSVLLAVSERILETSFSDQDVYCKVASGAELREPAGDLALLFCLWSARTGRVLPGDTLLLGEVGLGGELRSVPSIQARVKEARALGFKRFFVPHGNKKELELDRPTGAELRYCREVSEVAETLASWTSPRHSQSGRSAEV